ncbi:type IV pilin N-terminal domain-containing protein [Halobaculum lipolyticum]|uniref:Type IV pilin n=1 Tax=Halobaculum lipolyticum TaxID=3032001 RepID=A0ABD5W4A8_9EURY|nr:type IV pilin N-terminal domain-containing protein [Halobaculum sp. DT31]
MTPVIATVTMVAITVLLAAVLGAAMLDFSGTVGPGPPAVSVEFTYIPDGTEWEVYATIAGGETITAENTGNLSLVAETGETKNVSRTRFPLKGGDDIILGGGDTVRGGTVVRLVWRGPDGGSGVIRSGRTPY